MASLAQATAQSPRPARGDRHLWIPRGIGNAALLLALVLDRADGHPDNATATARMLGTDRETCRRWRQRLLDDGLIARADGYLIGTDAGRDTLRQSDPLPRALYRGRGPRPTPQLARACAVVYADAVGWRANRHGCRTDAERAAVAGVSRPTVQRARRLLADRDLIDVSEVRRGRADLRRARLTDDRKATHGAPMSDARAERLAAAALRGRRGAAQVVTRGAAQIASPIQEPTVPVPMQGPEPRSDGAAVASLRDGWLIQGGTTTTRDPIAAVLAAVAPPAVRAAMAADQVAASTAARTAATDAASIDLRRLAADRGAVARLLAMPEDHGCRELLATLRVDDRAPKRRAGRARQVAQMLGTAKLLALATDALLGHPRSLAAVVLDRIRRHAAGENPQTRCRADWSLAALLAAVAGDAVTAAGRVMPQRDHAPHRAIATAAASEAAQRGDWQRVDDLAHRHGLDPEAIADHAGIDPREVRQRILDLTNKRSATFAQARTA